MFYRKEPLVEGEMYHVFSRSIAGFKIFNQNCDYERIMKEMVFYQRGGMPYSFSDYWRCKKERDSETHFFGNDSEKIVDIIAYCFMPTHIHLILKQLKEDAISWFMSLILNSYTKYFNSKTKRKGPLWESRFKSVLIKNYEQFLHLTRYVHLNPVTSSLIDNPERWLYSSYREYLGLVENNKKICNFSNCFNMDIGLYEKFVKDRINYQRQLARIKQLILE